MRTFLPGELVCALALAAAASSCAQATNPGETMATNEITQALAAVRADDAVSIDASEDRLVALGPTNVAALRQVLGQKKSELSRSEQGKERALGEVLQLRQQIGALDDALIRLTWKVNPQELIAQFFAKVEPDKRPPLMQSRPLRIADDAVSRLFPEHLFYPAIVRQYPLAAAVAPPFKPQALFVIGRNGRLEYLADPGALEGFFRAHLKAADPGVWPNTAEARKDVVLTWLRLSQEFSQDGFFEFEIPSQQITVTEQDGESKATGRAAVVPRRGDHGEIKVVMVFHKDGTLGEVSETRNVHAGIRPKCQATKLLDPDPVVRAMAEQDILVMGRAAEPYLVERYSQADRELKARLQELWQRIAEEN